jgi:para-aminobenzoate synthetase
VNHSPFGPVHGQLSRVTHTGDHALLKGIVQGFQVVRYHSLAICNKDGTPSSFPSHLEKIAWTEDGVVMALGHRQLPLWGVQFHPESICTQQGDILLANFHNMSLAHHRAASTLPHSLPGDAVNGHAASRRGNPVEDELAWRASLQDFQVPCDCENKAGLRVLFRKIDAEVEPEMIYNHLYRYAIDVLLHVNMCSCVFCSSSGMFVAPPQNRP